MSEREVAAYLIGRRYDCDDCGEEMTRSSHVVAMTMPPKYPHACPNGHVASLDRQYPTYDVLIGQDPAPVTKADA